MAPKVRMVSLSKVSYFCAEVSPFFPLRSFTAISAYPILQGPKKQVFKQTKQLQLNEPESRQFNLSAIWTKCHSITYIAYINDYLLCRLTCEDILVQIESR